MLRVTCTQLVRLLNRDIVAYIVEEGKLSQGQVFYQNKEETNQQIFNTGRTKDCQMGL